MFRVPYDSDDIKNLDDFKLLKFQILCSIVSNRASGKNCIRDYGTLCTLYVTHLVSYNFIIGKKL